jgi:hypothetical protein
MIGVSRLFGLGRRRRTEQPEWLERLLGPAEPQVSCEECFAEIDRYVELEAAGHDAAAAIPGMKAHLEGCPACKEEHDELLEFLTAR